MVLIIIQLAMAYCTHTKGHYFCCSTRAPENRWTWDCIQGRCEKKRYANTGKQVSLPTCNMLCGSLQIWPLPTQTLKYEKRAVAFFEQQIFLSTKADQPVKSMIYSAFNIFIQNIRNLAEPSLEWAQTSDINGLNVSLAVALPDITRLRLETDESYSLTVKRVNEHILVHIDATTFFGARHSLETLSQLIWWDEMESGGMLKILENASIVDAPKFPYRGVMIDTARNFFSLYQLKGVADGMAASKLNVLHLHLTDSASFPLVLSGVEKLSEYGSYRPDMVYTEADILELIDYAAVRGIRVVLEVDAPSHVNSGWVEWGNYDEAENLVLCANDMLTGLLNPDSAKALDILRNIYSGLLRLSQDNQIFHIGGDEVDLNCWRRNAQTAHNYSDMKLFWADYTSKMMGKVKEANGGKIPENVVMWSSPLTDSSHLNKILGHENITIQFWLGSPRQFLSKGYKVIYSTVGHWYLDCGFGRWRPSMNHGVCDPYTPWQTFYEYRPWIEYSSKKEQTLGGEVCLWTEQVDIFSLETRLWPRAAAFAERVWSDPGATNAVSEVYTRLVSHRERLISRGIQVAALWPRWCSLNPGKCY